VTVREATAADLSTVRDLLQTYVDELWQRPFPPGPIREQGLDGRVVLVAEDEGRIVFVYVEPPARRRGIARALVGAFLAAASAAGAEHVTLDVDTSNDAARAVWQRFGFVEYARRLAATVPALAERLEPA
jgi:ribosomal protein S18 acetylase RimI-like enzyme